MYSLEHDTNQSHIYCLAQSFTHLIPSVYSKCPIRGADLNQKPVQVWEFAQVQIEKHIHFRTKAWKPCLAKITIDLEPKFAANQSQLKKQYLKAMPRPALTGPASTFG